MIKILRRPGQVVVRTRTIVRRWESVGPRLCAAARRAVGDGDPSPIVTLHRTERCTRRPGKGDCVVAGHRLQCCPDVRHGPADHS